MKTVHHIESADEVLHLFNQVRNGKDSSSFPFLQRSKAHLEISLKDLSIKLVGEESSKFKLDLSTHDVVELIALSFDRCGIDLQIVT